MSADEAYAEVRAKWAEIVNLSLYDDSEMVEPIASRLGGLAYRFPEHVPILRLLCALLIELGARDEACEVVAKLVRLEPDNIHHQEMLQLLYADVNDASKRIDFLGRFCRTPDAW